MKKIKTLAQLSLTAAFLLGSLTSCCCPKGPEITSNEKLEEVLPG